MARPVAFSTIAKGSDTPRFCSPSAVSTYAAISSTVRTGTGIQRHNSSSKPASASAARCAFASLQPHVLALQHHRGQGHVRCHDGRILRLNALVQRAPIWIWIENFFNVRNYRTNDMPLRVVGSQHGSSFYREVFAVSADLREPHHEGIIKPAVPSLPVESFQGFL